MADANLDNSHLSSSSLFDLDQQQQDHQQQLQQQQQQQKNKKRCFECRCKLDLALQAIGKCKCDYIFCPLHRLPEQHNCTFDHKEVSREEARLKMVVFKKHVGTALKRLDSDT
ncbi:hypothetical protein HELRODRAFT_87141 [Helobdella robusta]|uniref:AN1-type domain-containing protein n=1 Tax=Helobdella robusta TaxID=6412 RepID=T1G6M2_HELRO|nr:hypothetical protein HELRODRAFT_87141 [Helobdella robusta]ESN95130.1 hypothetical protein HELRODRAFT_87141 [Helobdella robusta]